MLPNKSIKEQNLVLILFLRILTLKWPDINSSFALDLPHWLNVKVEASVDAESKLKQD